MLEDLIWSVLSVMFISAKELTISMTMKYIWLIIEVRLILDPFSMKLPCLIQDLQSITLISKLLNFDMLLREDWKYILGKQTTMHAVAPLVRAADTE